MNHLADAMGELCKRLFPIPEEFYTGNPLSGTAICTLSSVDLLKRIANSDILGHVCIAGRLFSENRGIDALVRYADTHGTLKCIILCGRDVPGHRAGHSLAMLHRHGTDRNGRIVNSHSPSPLLTVTESQIARFQQVTLVDRIGLTDLGTIKSLVSSLSSASPG